MSGTDFVMNVAKGRLATYADLGAANDALRLVILQSTGLPSDAAMKDADTLAAILALPATECTATGYTRQTLASVTVTIDDTNDRVNIDCADVSLGAVGTAGSPQTQAKVLICYDNDIAAGTDANIVPLSAHSYDTVFDGSSVTITMPTDGPIFAG